MNKKVIGIIIAILLVLGVIIAVLLNVNSDNNLKGNSKDDNTIKNDISNQNVLETENEKDIEKKGKSGVIYFSATGNTEQIAGYIQEITDSDIKEIIPKEKYTTADLSYNNDDCRANKEQNNDKARPEIEDIHNIEDYDIIYLGYPIWWGDTPKVILTLLDKYDLSNKTVIPFCTSGSSGISQSMSTLKTYKKNVNWIEGKRFSSSTSKSEVESWINGLEISK